MDHPAGMKMLVSPQIFMTISLLLLVPFKANARNISRQFVFYYLQEAESERGKM
jgi:hypothetical protein